MSPIVSIGPGGAPIIDDSSVEDSSSSSPSPILDSDMSTLPPIDPFDPYTTETSPSGVPILDPGLPADSVEPEPASSGPLIGPTGVPILE